MIPKTARLVQIFSKSLQINPKITERRNAKFDFAFPKAEFLAPTWQETEAVWYHEELLHGGSEAPGPHQGGRKRQRRGTRDNGSESVSRWTDARGGDSPWATVYEAGVDPSGSQMLPWPWQPHSLPPKLARPSQGTLGAEGSWEAVVLSSTGGGGTGLALKTCTQGGQSRGGSCGNGRRAPRPPQVSPL